MLGELGDQIIQTIRENEQAKEQTEETGSEEAESTESKE
jgi:hypothetical protein